MSNKVVPASQIRNLPAVQRESAVLAYLSTARDRLADALASTGPEAVAAIKAEVSTIQEMTRQLGLSKECRDDATEMVRRAEYSLGKAIRKGQEEGTMPTQGQGTGGSFVAGKVRRGPDPTMSRIADLLPSGSGRANTYAVTDGVSDEQFDAVLVEARDEGNLSRANVVRKVKSQKPEGGRESIHADAPVLKAANVRKVVNNLSAYRLVFTKDAQLDPKLTNEEAARLAGDLSESVAALRRLIALLNNRKATSCPAAAPSSTSPSTSSPSTVSTSEPSTPTASES